MIDLARLWREAKEDAIADAVQSGQIKIEPGYWMVRIHLRAPEMPAMIQWREHEPSAPDNVMDRGHWAAAIAGQDCDPSDVLRCKTRRAIDESTYRFLLADRAWASEYAPEDPAALDPRRRADLTKLKPIF